jgi:uncharacterized protein YggT (Ycf19 family)
LTDPFLTPVRRYIRSIGTFDFSYLIAFVFLTTVQLLLYQGLANPILLP